MTEANPNIVTRMGNAKDKAFILSTWERSYSSSPTARQLGASYSTFWRALIEILYRKSEVLIATLADNPDLIIGYIVIDPEESLVHYLYVRGKTKESEGLQQAGVATALLEGINLSQFIVTHETKLTKAILARWAAEGRPTPNYEPATHFVLPSTTRGS